MEAMFLSVSIDNEVNVADANTVRLVTENGIFHIEVVDGGGIRIVGIDNRLSLAILPHSDNAVSIVSRQMLRDTKKEGER